MAKKPTYKELEQILTTRTREHEKTEKELRESLNYLGNLFNYANAPIIVWDPETKITRFNHAFEHLTGYAADEVMGKKLNILFPEASRDESQSKIANTLDGEFWESVEIPIIRNNGDVRIALWNSANIYAEDGATVVATIAQGQDVTDRIQTEETLKKSRAMLQAVFDGILDPLILLDRNFNIRMLNNAAVEYYQAFKFKNFLGRPCFKAFRGKTDPCEGCKILLAVQEGRHRTFKQKSIIQPGNHEQVVIYPVQEKESGVTGAIVHLNDITEKKKVQEQLIRAHRLSFLGKLSGGIAHEIRNPLAGISLFVDILCDKNRFDMTDQELEIMDEIRDNVNKIDGIIRNVLDFAKPSRKTMTEIDINALIREESELWSTQIRKSDINLELSLEDGISYVSGDSVGLRQVMNNLIQNALEVMETGGTLNITTTRGISFIHTDREVVIIKVKNSGPGIKPEHKQSIFDPFFTTKAAGTGLGLAITHQIIERHGGIVSCDSETGKGTTFTIELPLFNAKMIKHKIIV